MTTDSLTLIFLAAALAVAAWLALRRGSTGPAIVSIAGLKWTRADFCRGWLITGDTGSGKTSSGITPLLYQVFQNEPGWGGLCIDDKGLYWETLCEMARHFGRENDLILLQIRPDSAPPGWQPTHTYNLTSDRSIPYNTFSKAVVDTASSLGQAGDKGFFKNQAQVHIARALEMLREIRADVTLENAYHLLIDERDLQEALDDLTAGAPSPARHELISHFRNRFINQPPEQIGGVKETIANYLQAFVTQDIAQVFCPAANTFDFADIDRGKIICVAMPQKFQTERRYVNTFLKMLFYTHALRRFDKPKEERERDNLLVLWADEAQRFVTASEEGMSDYNCVDVIREAQAIHRLTNLRLLDYTITVNVDPIPFRKEISKEEKAHERVAGDYAKLSLLKGAACQNRIITQIPNGNGKTAATRHLQGDQGCLFPPEQRMTLPHSNSQDQ